MRWTKTSVFIEQVSALWVNMQQTILVNFNGRINVYIVRLIMDGWEQLFHLNANKILQQVSNTFQT